MVAVLGTLVTVAQPENDKWLFDTVCDLNQKP